MLYTALIESNGSEEEQQTHLPVTQKIAGVAPVGTANIGELAQLARAPALHAGGQEFESPILHHLIL